MEYSSRIVSLLRKAVDRPEALAPPTPGNGGEVWRSEIVSALRMVGSHLAEPGLATSDIHSVRRTAKRLRALVQLAPPRLQVLARETQLHANTLRRALAGARDATVHRSTLEKLTPQLGGLRDEIALLLDAGARNAGAPAIPSRLADDMAALARDWSLCDVREIDTAFLVDVAHERYRRGRRHAAKAKSGAVERMHKWRRAVVDHETHLLFFAQLAPSLEAKADRARRLRDALGSLHDLDALAEYVSDHDPQGHRSKALARAIKGQRRKLVRKAHRHGRHLFHRRPAKWKDGVLAAADEAGPNAA